MPPTLALFFAHEPPSLTCASFSFSRLGRMGIGLLTTGEGRETKGEKKILPFLFGGTLQVLKHMSGRF